MTIEACSEVVEVRQRLLDQEHRTSDVHLDGLGERVLAECADRLGQRVRRVVDDHVHTTEAIDRDRDQTPHVVERTHVARDPHDIEAERRELGFRRFTCLGLSAGNDETGAGSSEPLGHGAPDAPGPTGDDRGSAVEPEQLVDVDAHWSPDRFDPFVGSPLSMSAQWGLGRLLDSAVSDFPSSG